MEEQAKTEGWHLSSKELKSVRKRFLDMRRKLKVSQIALAKSAGLARQKLALWENGKVNLNPEEMFRLRAALDAAVIASAEANSAPQIDSESRALRSMRLHMDLTQQKLAQLVGLSQTDISIAENGHVPLSPEEMSKVKKVYDSWVAEHPEVNRTIPLNQLARVPDEAAEKESSLPVKQPLDEESRFKEKYLENLEKRLNDMSVRERANDRLIKTQGELIGILKQLVATYAEQSKELLSEGGVEKHVAELEAYIAELRSLLGLEVDVVVARYTADDRREQIEGAVVLARKVGDESHE